MTTRDSTPEGVAETLAATPAGAAPDAQLETQAVTADDVPAVTRRTGLPTVSRDVYRIDGELGRGGMGRVLRARDLRVDRVVAIKEALSPSRDLAARFEREALITARLQHPAIIPVYECGQWPNGEPFYAMKLVAGQPLDRAIAGAKDFAARVALLPHVIAVCEALAYAHDRGIIHRDLKPGNVLCGDYGETVVVDWGLAKDLSTGEAAATGEAAPAAPDMTRLGSAIGTPAYMAPEQARGEELDTRADVYALGAMLYHVLAGAAPYHRSKSAQEVIEAVMASKPPAPLAALAPGAPRELVAIAERAMAASIDARYPSAAELAADLRRFEAGQVVSAHRYSLGEMVRRWIRRHRAALIAAAAIVVAIGVVAVVMVRQVIQARDAARAQRAALLAESGRQELANGQPARALPYLVEAWRAGSRDPALRITLAEAARQVDDVERVLVHGDTAVVQAALARDGTAATLGEDGTVRMFRPDGGSGPAVDVEGARRIALSEDGALLATLGDELRVFDARSGAMLLRDVALDDEPTADTILLGANGHVVIQLDGNALFYARNGDLLVEDPARATPANQVAIVERASGAIDAVVLPTDQWTRAIAELRDARTGAIVDTITLADVTKVWARHGWLFAAVPLEPLPPPVDDWLTQPSVDVVWSITAIDLATGDRHTLRRLGSEPDDGMPLRDGVAIVADSTILRFDREGELRGYLATWEEPVLVGVLDVGTRQVAVVSEDGALRSYDTETGSYLGSFDGHGGTTYTAAVAPDGLRLVTGGADGRAVIWRPTVQLLAGGAGRSAVAPDGRWLRADGRSLVTDRAVELTGHTAAVIAIEPAWAANRAATLGADHTARLWDLSDGRTLATIPTDASAIALAPDGRRLATLSFDGIDVFDDAGGAIARLPPAADEPPEALTWSPDGTRLVVWSHGNTPVVWTEGAATLPATCAAAATVVRFAPSGDLAAIGTEDGPIVLCDVRTGSTEARLEGHTGSVTNLAFSADGARLVSSGDDGRARLWSVTARRSLAELDHGDDDIGAVAVRDDGAIVATLSAPSLYPRGGRPKCTLWDARTGSPLWERASEGTGVAFVPGGVAVAGDALAIWTLPIEQRVQQRLDEAFARGARWRLDAGGLVATIVAAPEVSLDSVKTYDFSGDTLDGELFRPRIELKVASPASADQTKLYAAWDRVMTGDVTGLTASTIDGAALSAPSERFALGYLRYLAGDLDGALRWTRAALASGDRTATYLQGLAIYLAASTVPGPAAIDELRAAGGDETSLLELARRIADQGRTDDAVAALDTLQAAGGALVEITYDRELIARAAGRADLAVAAWQRAIATSAPGSEVRAELLAGAYETAKLFHNEYQKAHDPLLADAARQLYTSILDVADAATLPELGEVIHVAAGLDRNFVSGSGGTGDLDKAIIRRAIKLHLGELVTCYERALVGDPSLEGTVSVTFTIDRSGRVDVESTLGPAPLAACVIASTQRWRFAASDATIDVTYPFTFQIGERDRSRQRFKISPPITLP